MNLNKCEDVRRHKKTLQILKGCAESEDFRKVGIGVYRKQDYEEILNLSEDKDNMEQTWEEWKEHKDKLQKELKDTCKQMDTLSMMPLTKPRK